MAPHCMERGILYSTAIVVGKDDTYKELNKDPTSRVETKIKSKLKELEEKGYISDKEKRFPSPQCSNPP